MSKRHWVRYMSNPLATSLTFLHAIGLTNLSDAEVDDYLGLELERRAWRRSYEATRRQVPDRLDPAWSVSDNVERFTRGEMVAELSSVEDVNVVSLFGKMTLGEGDELLKDITEMLLATNRKLIVLDLKGVPYIDSAGLGEIVRTYTTVSKSGGRLKLVGLTERIGDLLAISRLLAASEASVERAVSAILTSGLTVTLNQPTSRPPHRSRKSRGARP